ncbi:hypothetical protein V5799_023370 [Amblyomma americanum]|uniref:Uncharacterized protein n=1 Tax=Amblyomma americanum TaxID=6943 RepID=A0AAQ4FHZ2_AMBAM
MCDEDGGIVAPAPPVQEPVLSKEYEAEVLDKAGKTLEMVGRILQGRDVDSTKEEQQDILEVLQAVTAGEGAEGADNAEYIWPIIAAVLVNSFWYIFVPRSELYHEDLPLACSSFSCLHCLG